MATKNEITGDSIKSKGPSKEYSDNWDAVFGKKKKKLSESETMQAELEPIPTEEEGSFYGYKPKHDNFYPELDD